MPTELQVKRMTRPCFLVRIAAGVSLPAVLLLLPQPSGAAEPPAKGAEPFAGAAAFLEKHCLACHDADDPSGNLDLGALKFNADDRDNFARWVRFTTGCRRVKCRLPTNRNRTPGRRRHLSRVCPKRSLSPNRRPTHAMAGQRCGD